MGTTIMKNSLYFCFVILFVGCGNPVLRDFQAKPITEDDGSVAVEISSEFNVGGASLPVLNLPIKHPKKGYEIGVLTTDGKRVKLKINLSEIAPLQSVLGTLPNGTAIPFASSNEVVAIPVGGKGIFIYASWVENDVVLGFSIPLKALDAIGQKVGSINLMPRFTLNKFTGAAGTYFSQQAGSNGIALFANLGGLFAQEKLSEMYYLTEASYFVKESLSDSEEKIEVTGQVPSSKTEKTIAKGIQALSQRKENLTID